MYTSTYPFSMKYIQHSSNVPCMFIISSGVIRHSLIRGTVSLITASLKLFLNTIESFRTKLFASKDKASFRLSLNWAIIFSSYSVSLNYLLFLK